MTVRKSAGIARSTATIQRMRPCRSVHRTYAVTPGPGPPRPEADSATFGLRFSRGDARVVDGGQSRRVPGHRFAAKRRDDERVQASRHDVDDPVMIEVNGGKAHPQVEDDQQRASETSMLGPAFGNHEKRV